VIEPPLEGADKVLDCPVALFVNVISASPVIDKSIVRTVPAGKVTGAGMLIVMESPKGTVLDCWAQDSVDKLMITRAKTVNPTNNLFIDI
jgi:hypothetical protein